MSRGKSWSGVIGAILLWVGSGWACQQSIAVDQETLLLLANPLEIQLLNSPEGRAELVNRAVVTPETISQTSLTVPSLWWAKERFGGDLLEYWFGFPADDGIPPRVDLLVNQQVWSSYDYFQRYAFVNQFGKVSEDFGYSTRVFNWRGELLGAYICSNDRSTAATSVNVNSTAELQPALSCQVFLSPSPPNSFTTNAPPVVQ